MSHTRQHLRAFAGHPDVQWLQQQYETAGLLGLAMQTVQLGHPPEFVPPAPEAVPPFVDEYFADVSRERLSQALQSLWQEAGVGEVLASQAPLWREAAADLSGALSQAELEPFQQLFYGRFPYTAVVVPVWNMSGGGLRGVGVANRRETYAVCLSGPQGSLRSEQVDLLVLTQHEASHPVLDDIQRLYPEVPGACAFVEQAYPPGGRFACAYGDPTFRWVETVIRSSTYFYLTYIGRTEAAESFIAAQVSNGVTLIRPFVAALRPWWQERLRGSAPGLDGALRELPAWLGAAVGP